jgi:hypothetical protein
MLLVVVVRKWTMILMMSPAPVELAQVDGEDAITWESFC